MQYYRFFLLLAEVTHIHQKSADLEFYTLVVLVQHEVLHLAGEMPCYRNDQYYCYCYYHSSTTHLSHVTKVLRCVAMPMHVTWLGVMPAAEITTIIIIIIIIILVITRAKYSLSHVQNWKSFNLAIFQNSPDFGNGSLPSKPMWECPLHPPTSTPAPTQ